MSTREKLERNEARSRARTSAQSSAPIRVEETKEPPPATGPKIKPWPEEVRSVPNPILRSALFGAVKKGSRALFEREHIASPKGQKIYYTGVRLDQIDLTVWLCALHLARDQPLGKELCFTAYSLLKLMKKTDTGKNRKILHERLMRLKAGTVEITQRNVLYIGSLLKDVHQNPGSSKYVLMFDAKLHVLFPSDGFTYVDWVIRSALDRQPLAQWLHGFYSSHVYPYPMKVTTLHRLCGSEASEMWKFTQTLRRALSAVSATCEAHGDLFMYDIRGELVHIEKRPSISQRRHILKSLRKLQKSEPKLPFQRVGTTVSASSTLRSSG
ncbi:plasmid replication initiator TrfA [Pseudomonas sp. RTB3]|nr:plasmid replication initiator TrfA [Pseudomonas sp. RTB2]MEB0006637.1 plasmid replication initiator TrfA [Pseudomonas sp. RTB2]MEB0017267.1 plasmid replication initiator TrfA [Pseudomonas sp. RTB3]MEB0270644.1 plasmid replication initiator TrfA [Pseudomonas sp. 5B4]